MHPILLILTATEAEQTALRDGVRGPLKLILGHRPYVVGRIAGRDVALLETGIGAVNTAQALTAALESDLPDLVLQTGIGGAYTRSGLEIGDLAIASEEIYGELGVITPEGWRGAEEIGIPVVRNDRDYFNRFPVDVERAERAEKVLLGAEWQHGRPGIKRGSFVTVQQCSGIESIGNELAALFGAICESMEGAAAAHVCTLYRVPFLQVRGISNRVIDRDLSTWNIPLAVERSQQAVLTLIEKESL